MNKIIEFIPKQELTAKKNLKNMIAISQNHLVLWGDHKDFCWEDNRWFVGHRAIRFTNHESRLLHPSKEPKPNQLMHPQFIKFAKGYLRYYHTINPHLGIAQEMATLRVLEMVLRKNMVTPDITKINQRHFDQVMAEIRLNKRRQYIAIILLKILKNLADWFIVTRRAHYWQNPYIGIASYSYDNGAYADADTKSSKLPNQNSLLAIAEVFGRGHIQKLEDADTMITSITCLLLSVPMRISETLRLRVDCINQEIDSNGKNQLYINYWTPKTREFVPKAIPATMAPHASIAVDRLKRITEESRRLARYMEGNPTEFYRHNGCPNVDEHQELTLDQVTAALGFSNVNSSLDFIRRHTGTYSSIGFTLSSLWKFVLAEHRQLNPYFPYQEPLIDKSVKPLKMSESLLCFRRFQLGVRSNTSPILLAPFNGSYYRTRVAANSKVKGKNLCFFTRHGFKAVKLTSHSLRHLLNRLARRSGVSIDTITTWSSRASTDQTLTYLNDDPQDAASRGSILLEMQQAQTHKEPITNKQEEMYGQGPFHRSRYGLCRRSWRAGPCNRFADCLNCSELLICKGDKLAVGAVAKDRDNLVQTYKAAKYAVDKGEKSATRWMQVAEPQIERLTQLLNILGDSCIPDGSPVELSNSVDFCHEESLIKDKAIVSGVKLLDRKELSIEYGNELLDCLDLLKGPYNG